MNRTLKLTSLAALTAATLSLPAAAADVGSGAKCRPAAEMSKCGAKPAAKCQAQMKTQAGKCGAHKCAAKCAPKCGPKCGPKK